MERRKLEEERKHDLRAVIDEAATAGVRRSDVILLATTFGEISDELARSRGLISAQQGRLGVRVGPDSDVYLAYEDLDTALSQLEHAANDLPRDMSVQTVRERWHELPDPLKAAYTSAMDAEKHSEEALKEFLRAANATVGSTFRLRK
jgi:hypothetical protein